MTESILDRVLVSYHSDVKDQINPVELIEELLESLTPREAQVIRYRFGIDGAHPQTLEKIGTSFDITRERVRQIERLSVTKIKESPQFNDLIKPLDHAVAHELMEYGGARAVDQLLSSFTATDDDFQRIHHIITFIITHLLDSVDDLDQPDMFPAWKMRHVNLSHLDAIIEELVEFMVLNQEPREFEHLWKQFRSGKFYTTRKDEWIENHPLPNESVTEDHLSKCLTSCMEMSKRVDKNPFGAWGLSEWPSIRPKRMADKIYLILKQHSKPLHFNDITELINKTGFDHKVAHAPTVHNELILDDRFVLVGRGIYALREWGYKDGVVSDVISDILLAAGRPLTRDEIVLEVNKRRIVKRGTIYLSLSDRTRFNRTSDGKYFVPNTSQTELA